MADKEITFMMKMEGEYIRRLKEMDEFYELVAVQRNVWGYEDIDLIPAHIFRDASNLMGPNGLVLIFH